MHFNCNVVELVRFKFYTVDCGCLCVYKKFRGVF